MVGDLIYRYQQSIRVNQPSEQSAPHEQQDRLLVDVQLTTISLQVGYKLFDLLINTLNASSAPLEETGMESRNIKTSVDDA